MSGKRKSGRSQANVLWYAPPWWLTPVPEPMEPEGINFHENPITLAFELGELGPRPDPDCPIDKAMEKGRFGDPKGPLAQRRQKAGHDFMALWDMIESSGTDSTQKINVSRSDSGGFSDKRAEAMQTLKKVRSHLGTADAIIIQKVCGERAEPSAAVRAACGDGYKFEITARLCEALDALRGAFRLARTEGERKNFGHERGQAVDRNIKTPYRFR